MEGRTSQEQRDRQCRALPRPDSRRARGGRRRGNSAARAARAGRRQAGGPILTAAGDAPQPEARPPARPRLTGQIRRPGRRRTAWPALGAIGVERLGSIDRDQRSLALQHSIRSSRFRFGILSAIVAALLVPTGTASAGTGCTFKVVQHPDVGDTPFDVLSGIDALSATNIWVVGSSGAFAKPLVE